MALGNCLVCLVCWLEPLLSLKFPWAGKKADVMTTPLLKEAQSYGRNSLVTQMETAEGLGEKEPCFELCQTGVGCLCLVLWW